MEQLGSDMPRWAPGFMPLARQLARPGRVPGQTPAQVIAGAMACLETQIRWWNDTVEKTAKQLRVAVYRCLFIHDFYIYPFYPVFIIALYRSQNMAHVRPHRTPEGKTLYT